MKKINKKTMLFLTLTIICTIITSFMLLTEGVGAGGSSQTQNLGYKVTVNYADGSTEDFDQFEMSPFQLYTLFNPSGKEIDRFDFRLQAVLSTSGVVDSWVASGTQQIELYKAGVVKESAPYSITKSGQSWEQGDIKELKYTPLSWDMIEAAIARHGTGDWSIQINANINIDVTFESGSVDSESGEAHLAIDFTYGTTADYISDFRIIVRDMPVQQYPPFSLASNFANVGLPTWTGQLLFAVLSIVFCILTVYFSRTEE